jgi:hypothetical protein
VAANLGNGLHGGAVDINALGVAIPVEPDLLGLAGGQLASGVEQGPVWFELFGEFYFDHDPIIGASQNRGAPQLYVVLTKK